MDIEYNNYGFASCTSSLEETIQFIVSGIDLTFFFQIKSYSLPIQEYKESNHQPAAFLRIQDQEHSHIINPELFYKTPVTMNTFILQKGRNTDSWGDTHPEQRWDSIVCLSHPQLWGCPPCSTQTLPPFLFTQEKLGQIESSQSSWHDFHCSKSLLPAGQPMQLLLKRCFFAEGWHLQEEEAQLPKEE